MQKTEKKNLNDVLKPQEEKTLSAVSPAHSLTSKKEESGQMNLSRSTAEHLHRLMKDVTAKEVSAYTVRAACECAKEIREIIRLNIELKKLGF